MWWRCTVAENGGTAAPSTGTQYVYVEGEKHYETLGGLARAKATAEYGWPQPFVWSINEAPEYTPAKPATKPAAKKRKRKAAKPSA